MHCIPQRKSSMDWGFCSVAALQGSVLEIMIHIAHTLL
jgi:hypothetical protein